LCRFDLEKGPVLRMEEKRSKFDLTATYGEQGGVGVRPWEN
jgi:hypothetical protein